MNRHKEEKWRSTIGAGLSRDVFQKLPTYFSKTFNHIHIEQKKRETEEKTIKIGRKREEGKKEAKVHKSSNFSPENIDYFWPSSSSSSDPTISPLHEQK